MAIKIILACVALVMAAIVVLAYVEDKDNRKHPLQGYVPSPDLTDREVPPTYQDLSNNLIEYANELAQQLKQEPA